MTGPEMLDRYERFVAPAAALVDEAALGRIGERWRLTPDNARGYAGPTAIVAGRLDSTVGHAAAVDLVDRYPHASLAVVNEAGHALPHEQPELDLRGELFGDDQGDPKNLVTLISSKCCL
jgi:pimeloyl-ACP methyl ester carboxylesterase